MKKASAIITDEGGVGSHAAIISRELKIPCIIGTKIATQVLHDGDLVEVDANNGVVRVLERAKEEEKESRFTFVWSNFQTHITVQNNIETMIKFPEIDWNNIKEIFEVSRNNRISTYHSKEDLINDRERGKLLFNKKYSDKIFNEIDKLSKEYNEMFKDLDSMDYTKLSNKELNELLTKVYNKWSNMVSYFRFNQAEGSHYIIEELKKYFSAEELSILMLPHEPDAVIYEQIDWQELIKKPYSEKELLGHAKKYPWMVSNHFTYKDVIDTFKGRYEFDKIHLKIKDLLEEKEELKVKQEEILNKNQSKRELVNLVQIIALSRIKVKSCWSGTEFYLIPLYNEISKRTKENLYDLWMYYLREDIKDLTENKVKLSNEEKKRRKQCFVGHWKDGKSRYYSGEEAERVAERELGSLYKIKQVKELTGVSAYPGKVKGKARILESNNVQQTRDLRHNFKRGDILITQMTQPNIMDIASKASAIVTDEGGMLSHAAIISRELKIPCIVGTHFASEIIKNGDLIEVDADNGVVRILERAK